MNHNDVLLLGVKSKVMAISKLDGRTIWAAELPSGMGQGFVTVLSDDRHVFAHTHGQVHCLGLEDGRVLWTNDLPGCGYGLASLSFPGGATAPDASAVQTLFNEQESAAGAAVPPVLS
jgi:outer membrane protein assembly factor BamB